MGGHDGQPIPKLVGHVFHWLVHATEFKSLVYACTCTTGSTSASGEAANKVN